MSTGIQVWNQELFESVANVGPIDTFITNGVSATYSAPNKTYDQIASTIEYSNTQKNLYNGGFTNNGDGTITINTVPPSGLSGVIPATKAVVFDSYDQDNVSGVTNPRQCETHFWIGNLNDIANYKFAPKIGSTGISVYFVNNITGIGPDVSWYQLASCNASSVAGTYGATGGTLNMLPISASATLTAGVSASAVTINVSTTGTNPDIFQAADYIVINPGQTTSEIARIVSVGSSSLTLKYGLTYDHNQNETIYVFAREVSALEITPLNATNDQAQTFYNMSIQVIADKIQRT